jgi:hypothetical protein
MGAVVRALITLALVLLTALLAVAFAAAGTAHALGAPRPLSPRNSAKVQQLPAITWSAVRGAAAYEYEISGNPRFTALVGSGPGHRGTQTHNLAAVLEKEVSDGTFYWRVRALGRKNQGGRWSRVRKIVKRWSAKPALTGGDGVVVNWPSSPLVLRWSSVPYAFKYLVTIATDPGLSNVVLGTKTKPVTTQAVNYALPISLDSRAGAPYYWAITPLDAEGHRECPDPRQARCGLPVGTFTWTWPTSTTTSVIDLNPEAGAFADPLFSWAPVPGAARYEVEVNAAVGFPTGSKWCCSGTTTATSLAPLSALANNRYYWRVRAIDPRGNAGVWNEGQPFDKAFDPTKPSIRNLTVRDAEGHALSGVPATSAPIVTWDPVQGASRYEVQYVPHETFGCDWSRPLQAETSTTAWTPLGSGRHIGSSAWPGPESGPALSQGVTFSASTVAGSKTLTEPKFEAGQPNVDDIVAGPGIPPDTTISDVKAKEVTISAAATATGTHVKLTAAPQYCLRVTARSDDDAQHGQVVSEPTQLNGVRHAAFAFAPAPEKEAGSEGEVLQPAAGSLTPRTPYFTWRRISGAEGYYVVIARDAGFTEVTDVGFTNVPAYAPRLTNEVPLSDETTEYHWAVIPAAGFDGSGVGDDLPQDNNPQVFNKSSVPPVPLSPGNGEAVSVQPRFEWSPAENARNYLLQVSLDPTFGKPIDNVVTDATAYVSNSTYPANTPLYWRVRANDWIGQGLNWSPTRQFVRILSAPQPAPFGASAALATTPLVWSSLQGAIAYDVHIDQADGKAKNYTFQAPSASFVEYYGTGGFGHFEVRAEFPTSRPGVNVPGPYSAPMQTPTLTLPPPSKARGTKSGSRVLITWSPVRDAKRYRVEISKSNGFARNLETHTVDGTSWAPNIDLSRKGNRGRLYWRVAPVDAHNGVGSFAAGTFGGKKPHAGKKSHAKGRHR